MDERGKPEVKQFGVVAKEPDPKHKQKVVQFGSGLYRTKVIRPAPADLEEPNEGEDVDAAQFPPPVKKRASDG